VKPGDMVMKRPDPSWPRPEAWPKLTPGIITHMVPPPHSGTTYTADKYHVIWAGGGHGDYCGFTLEVISEAR